MSSLLPIPSNGYAVTVNFEVSAEVWNAALPHLAGRVGALETIVAAGYTAAQEAGTAMAQDIIANSVAPQIVDIQALIAGFETQLSIAEDKLAALQNGGVPASDVPLAPYGMFGPGTDTQEAFEAVSDALTTLGNSVTSLGTGKMDANKRGAANGVAPLGADQKVPDANVQGDTLRVGDLLTTNRAPGAKFLKTDGSKYLKASYPALDAASAPTKLFDSTLVLNPAVTSVTVQSGGAIIGNGYAVVAATNVVVSVNLKTNVATGYTANTPVNSSMIVHYVYFNPLDGLFYIVWVLSSAVYIKKFNAATGAFTDVTHNLGAASYVGFLAFINGYWYASAAGKLVRGTTLNTMASPVGIPATDVMDPPAVHSDGTYYAITNTVAPVIYKSTNQGANWSLHDTLVYNGAVSFDTKSTAQTQRKEMIFEWQGEVYARADQASTGTQGYLWKINPLGVSIQWMNRGQLANGIVSKIGDDFLVMYTPTSDTNGAILDAKGNLAKSADLLSYFGIAAFSGDALANLGDSLGRFAYDPVYGGVNASSTNSIQRQFSSHNYDTEFRVPRITPGSSGVQTYVKALP